jgi:hypothetical protein
MVHRRQVNGSEIVLGNQGALWGNAMTWWDHETGSVWSQPIGEAIAGPLAGTTLELLPSNLTEWGAWREAHPDTLALDAPGEPSRFSLDRTVLVVDFGSETVAYPVPDLRRHGVVNDVVAGVEVAVLFDPADDQRWAVFSRRLDGRSVELVVEDGLVVDVETGTTWDPVRGIALSGPLEGEVLDLLPGFTSFPQDFFTFWPQGRVWAATSDT